FHGAWRRRESMCYGLLDRWLQSKHTDGCARKLAFISNNLSKLADKVGSNLDEKRLWQSFLQKWIEAAPNDPDFVWSSLILMLDIRHKSAPEQSTSDERKEQVQNCFQSLVDAFWHTWRDHQPQRLLSWTDLVQDGTTEGVTDRHSNNLIEHLNEAAKAALSTKPPT
ncbi:MAG: hypothetical protein ACPGUV_15335, partial [Polyangiales bacterium]